MITTKSPREIELMRQAGEIVALAHQAVARSIKAGMRVSGTNRPPYRPKCPRLSGSKLSLPCSSHQ